MARVAVRADDRRTVEALLLDLDGTGLEGRAFIALLSSTADPSMIVASDETGVELDSQHISDLDH